MDAIYVQFLCLQECGGKEAKGKRSMAIPNNIDSFDGQVDSFVISSSSLSLHIECLILAVLDPLDLKRESVIQVQSVRQRERERKRKSD